LLLHRRTRAVFSVALKANQSIQERDITFGRNMGNYILQRLNRMKPMAQTPGGSPSIGAHRPSLQMTKLASSFSNSKASSYYQLFKRKSGKQSTWFQQQSIWSKPFPSIVKMMRPRSLAGTTTDCRHLNVNASHAFRPNYRVNWPGHGIRKDIMQWMVRN